MLKSEDFRVTTSDRKGCATLADHDLLVCASHLCNSSLQAVTQPLHAKATLFVSSRAATKGDRAKNLSLFSRPNVPETTRSASRRLPWSLPWRSS